MVVVQNNKTMCSRSILYLDPSNTSYIKAITTDQIDQLLCNRRDLLECPGAEGTFGLSPGDDTLSFYLFAVRQCVFGVFSEWVSKEKRLFRARVEDSIRLRGVWATLTALRVNFPTLSKDQFECIKDDLEQMYHRRRLGFPSEKDFVGLPFEYAGTLIGRRLCCVFVGCAVVHYTQILECLVDMFTMHIEALGRRMRSRVLREMAESHPDVTDDHGIMYYILNQAGVQVTQTPRPISLPSDSGCCGDIDEITKRFPPCIQRLHCKLVKEKHLKYQDRSIYAMFLGSLGSDINSGRVIDFIKGVFVSEGGCDPVLWKKKYETHFSDLVMLTSGSGHSIKKLRAHGCGSLCVLGVCAFSSVRGNIEARRECALDLARRHNMSTGMVTSPTAYYKLLSHSNKNNIDSIVPSTGPLLPLKNPISKTIVPPQRKTGSIFLDKFINSKKL